MTDGEREIRDGSGVWRLTAGTVTGCDCDLLFAPDCGGWHGPEVGIGAGVTDGCLVSRFAGWPVSDRSLCKSVELQSVQLPDATGIVL